MKKTENRAMIKYFHIKRTEVSNELNVLCIVRHGQRTKTKEETL